MEELLELLDNLAYSVTAREFGGRFKGDREIHTDLVEMGLLLSPQYNKELGSLEHFFWVVMRNQLIKYIRKSRITLLYDPLLDTELIAGSEDSPDEYIGLRLDLENIIQRSPTLSKTAKIYVEKIVRLLELGFNQAEIGNKLGLTRARVCQYISMLRASLKKAGYNGNS